MSAKLQAPFEERLLEQLDRIGAALENLVEVQCQKLDERVKAVERLDIETAKTTTLIKETKTCYEVDSTEGGRTQ